MQDAITIFEVGPRDGLQNETQTIPTEIKIQFINALANAGIKKIETTSFVSPKRIPQLADNINVLAGIERKPHVAYSALVPNLEGFEQSSPCHLNEIAVFAAASETFSHKNTNCSIAESLTRINDVCQAAQQIQQPVRAYLSCVLGCPYEGKIDIKVIVKLAKQLIAMGCYEVSLGDTIGVGTASQAKNLVAAVANEIGINKIGVHFHDTYGQALTNIYACLQLGVKTIDSSTAGLGGCPYAPGASGNVATEDVIYLLNGLGIHTGVNLEKCIEAGNIINTFLNRPSHSKTATAIKHKKKS